MPAGSRSKRTQSLSDPAEYASVIPKIPLLARLSDDSRHAVAQLMLQISKAYELSPGEALYERGQEDENTGALLVRGTMRIRKRGGDSIFVDAPQILGEIQQFTKSSTRTATVEAENDVTVLEFGWSDFTYMATELGALKPGQFQEFQSTLKAWANERLAELGDSEYEGV